MPESTFIGRDEYISLFKKLMSNPIEEAFILNLRGVGGIGKTKILNEIVSICREEKIPNTGIIDFYDSALNSQIRTVEFTIASSLSKDGKLENGPFKKYWIERSNAQALHDKIDSGYNMARETSKNQFFDDLKKWSESHSNPPKKGVLIFDTFEAVKNKPVGARLVNDWLPLLKHSVVIISGRQSEKEIEFPKSIENLVFDEPVEEFSENEARAYLEARGVWSEIQQDDVVEEIFKLTNRQPLRLAICTDRLLRYNFLKPLQAKDLVAGANKKTFEKKIVEEMVVDMHYPEVTVLPAMAHVPRPFDIELINWLFPEEKNPGEILQNLSELSFIKEIEKDGRTHFWFQDELRSMFHKYVFEGNKLKWKVFRQETSQKMLTFYKELIEKAENDSEAKNQAIADKYYHEIFLDSRKFEEAKDKFQEARNVYEGRLASMILSSVSSASDFLDKEQQFSLQLMEARLLRDNEYINQSKNELETLLRKYGPDKHKAVYIHNALGGTFESLGKLDEALNNYLKALEISKALKKNDRLAREELNVGRVYRRKGNMQESIKHLINSLDLSYETIGNGKEESANCLYELGYAYMSFGRYSEGLVYCNDAIGAGENLRNGLLTAKGKVLRGAILREMDRIDESLSEINEAIEIYTKQDYYYLGEAFFHRGVVQWVKAIKNNDDKSLLKEAERSLESSISKSKEDRDLEFWALALDRISNVYWKQNKKEKAWEAVNEAYRVAESHGYYGNAINSLLGMAEFHYEEGQYDELQEYFNKIVSNYETIGSFPLYSGRIRRILGDVALSKHDFDRAAQYYAEGLYLISRHGGYGVRSIDSELENLEQKLLSISNTGEARNICKTLKESWINKELNENLLKMINRLMRFISRLSKNS